MALSRVSSWAGLVSEVMVSHLLFADDTLVFCDAEISQVGYLQLVLLFFQMVSGLRVNIAKSEIIPVGGVDDIGALASFLGAELLSFPRLILVYRLKIRLFGI